MSKAYVVTRGSRYPRCLYGIFNTREEADAAVELFQSSDIGGKGLSVREIEAGSTSKIMHVINGDRSLYFYSIKKFDLANTQESVESRSKYGDCEYVDIDVNNPDGWIRARSRVSSEHARSMAMEAWRKAKSNYDAMMAYREVVKKEEIERLEARLKALKGEA